jgi:hypothetical protein
LRFKSLKAGSNITIDDSDPDELEISASVVGGSDQIQFATPITSTSADLTKADHAGKWVEVNNASDITLTIKDGQFEQGDVITIEQIGLGQVEIEVENSGDQTIVTDAVFSWGQYSVIQVVCKQDTTGDEIWTVIGGSE